MKPTIFSFTCNMFDFLTKKKDILRICVEENMVKSSKIGHTASEYNKKKHLQKRTGTAKRSASMSKPIKISSNEILTTICARLLDRLAQVHGGYVEHK